MALYLRKVIHPQAHGNYRVILKCEDGEFEIGSIGIQHDGAWSCGIDSRPDASSADPRERRGPCPYRSTV